MTDLNAQMVEVLSGIRSEIKVDAEGKGSITKYGLATILGISHSILNRDRIPKKLAENITAKGFDDRDREFKNGIPDIAVQCIVRYYAYQAQRTSEMAEVLSEAFETIGIRAWFQDVTGFTKPKPTTQMEQMEIAIKAMTDMVAIMKYTSNKPGLQNIIDCAISSDGLLLPGLITVRSELQRMNLTATFSQMKDIGRKASEAYKNSTGQAPSTIKVLSENKDSKCKTYRVTAYPLDASPIIENSIRYVLNIS